MTLQQQYLQALRKSQTRRPKKTLIGKSAVVALRDGSGEVIGYGEAEHIPLDDPRHPSNRLELSKAADLNSIFDDSPLMPDFGDVQTIEIKKAVQVFDQDDAIFCGTFPTCLQPQ